MRLTIVWLVVVAGAWASAVRANESQSRMALLEMLDRRMKLVSGRCVITGSVRQRVAGEKAVKIEMTFDFVKTRLRLDQKDHGKYLSDGRWQYVSPGEQGAEIRRYALRELPRMSIDPFDIRGLGLIAEPSLVVPTLNALRFSDLAERLRTASVVKSDKEGSLLRIVIRLSKRPGDHFAPVYRMWLSPTRDFATLRFEQIDDQADNRVVWASEMTWKKMNGVWLIDTFRQETFDPGGGTLIQWRLEWSDVNRPISESEFQVRNLIPEGRTASLYSIDKPSNRTIELGKISRPNPGDPVQRIPRSLYFNWAKAMYVSGIVLIIIAGLVVMGRKWRR